MGASVSWQGLWWGMDMREAEVKGVSGTSISVKHYGIPNMDTEIGDPAITVLWDKYFHNPRPRKPSKNMDGSIPSSAESSLTP